jgi:hypothetical protein
MIPQRVSNLNRAKNWRFQVAKDQRASVTGRQTEEFSFGFGSAKLVGSTHDLAQCLNVRALLCGAQFGITDDVDKEDVRDLKAEFRFLLVLNWDGKLAAFSTEGPWTMRARFQPRILLRQGYGVTGYAEISSPSRLCAFACNCSR